MFKITTSDWKAGKKKIQLDILIRDIESLVMLAKYRGHTSITPIIREWIIDRLRIERKCFKKYGLMDNSIQSNLWEIENKTKKGR